MYERFDAEDGVSKIRLDDHSALGIIRAKTEDRLRRQDTKDLLDDAGLSIATDNVNTFPPAHCDSLDEMQPTRSNSAAPRQVAQGSIPMLVSLTGSNVLPNASEGHPHHALHVQFPIGGNVQSGRPASSVGHHTLNKYPRHRRYLEMTIECSALTAWLSQIVRQIFPQSQSILCAKARLYFYPESLQCSHFLARLNTTCPFPKTIPKTFL